MPSIADVFVTLLPETSKMADGIKRAFRDADPIATEAGRRWGQEIEKGLGTVKVKLDADTGKADEKIKEATKDRKVKAPVEPETDKAKIELARFRAEQERKAIRQKIEFDEADTKGKLDILAQRFGSQFDGVGGKLAAGLKLNVGLVGVGSLPAAATAITDVAGALQQLAGAGLAIPGIFAGVAASVSTAVLGMSGMKDAWDAASAAADSSGVDQAAQAKAVASAQQSLTDATISQSDAQRGLSSAWKDARQQLDDLNLSLQGGKISEAQAYNDLLKARRDLARGGFKDRLEYNDAVLRVESSEQRWEESKQRNNQLQSKANEENAKGVAGSDLVVSAQERVTRANGQVATSQRNLNDAQDKTSTSARKAADAMAKLSPNAAETVRTLIGLKDTFLGLRNSAGQNMFAGVSEGIKGLVTADLPALSRGVDGISRGINQNIVQMMKSLGSADSQGFLSRILGNTGDAQSRLTAAIDPIVHAVGVLSAAGSDTLPRLATAVGAVADRFNRFITAADSDGRLDKWIKDGLDGLTSLGNIVLNLGKSFTAVTQAAGGGAGLLGTIQSATEKLQVFLNSTAGQNKLREFFADGRNMLGQLRDVAAQLLPLLPAVFNVAHDAANFWPPVVREALQVINSIPGGAQAVVTAFVAWKSISGVASLASALTNVANLLKITLPAAAVSGAGGVTAALGPLAAAGGPILAIGAAVATATAGLYKLRDLVAQKDAEGDRSLGDLLFGRKMNDAMAPAANNGGGGTFGAPGFGPSVDPNWKPVLQPSQTPGTYRRRDGTQGTIPTPASNVPQPAIQPVTPSGTSLSPTSVPAAGYTSDQALLANVPAGTYSNGPGDLTKGLADCSSAVEDLVNLMDGRQTAGRSMATGNEAAWLTAHGFVPGMGGPGDFRVGFNDHHTQATLPGGTPFNWGSDAAAARGGVGGTGADDPAFTQHYYRPVSAGMPGGPIPAVAGPTGGATDPYYTVYPDGYKPPGPDMEQFGQSMGNDLGELFLPDGFKNPKDFGIAKLATGFINGLTGLKLGGQNDSAGSFGGGGGGDMGGLLGMIPGINPQPMGALQSGSPGNAPGQFMPLMPNPADAAISPFQVTGPAGTAGPGNQNNSINIINPIGQDHLQGMVTTATQAQVPRVRQGVRPLP